MKAFAFNHSKAPAFLAAAAAGLALVLAAGCSRTEEEPPPRGYTGVFTPQVPAFLTEAEGWVLTNATSYSARVEVTTESAPGPDADTTGQLLCRGHWLLFAPQVSGGVSKQAQAGRFAFIWNVAENRGFVLSDGLQGYACVTNTPAVTNLARLQPTAPTRKIGGYVCRMETATAQCRDGTQTALEVFRAADLKGLPVEVRTRDAAPRQLTLSKVRFETIAEDVFAPPAGFTRYDNPGVMADELPARQRNLKRAKSNRSYDMPP